MFFVVGFLLKLFVKLDFLESKSWLICLLSAAAAFFFVQGLLLACLVGLLLFAKCFFSGFWLLSLPACFLQMLLAILLAKSCCLTQGGGRWAVGGGQDMRVIRRAMQATAGPSRPATGPEEKQLRKESDIHTALLQTSHFKRISSPTKQASDRPRKNPTAQKAWQPHTTNKIETLLPDAPNSCFGPLGPRGPSRLQEVSGWFFVGPLGCKQASDYHRITVG